MLHSISTAFKSLLRPSEISSHDKSPADSLAGKRRFLTLCLLFLIAEPKMSISHKMKAIWEILLIFHQIVPYLMLFMFISSVFICSVSQRAFLIDGNTKKDIKIRFRYTE